MYVLCRYRNATLLARVALVSKEEQDKAKSTVVEDFLPLRQLGVNGRGLPCEDEIALATVNTWKELEKKRKPERAQHGQGEYITTSERGKN